jgi:hypothetical protein
MRRKVFKNGGDPEDPYDPAYNWGANHSSKRVSMADPQMLSYDKTPAVGKQVSAFNAPGRTAGFDSPGTMRRSNVFSKFGDIVPYVSNLANSFRHPPLPQAPGMVGAVSASHVSADGQLVEADRSVRGMNGAADRNLDENTAAAVKGSNMAQGIRAKNSVYESVNNTNVGIDNQNRQLNAGIEMQNMGVMNQWKNNLTEAQVVDQREQSANLSNAADKYVGQQQFRDAQQLDRDKWEAYKPMWKNSGVSDRAYGADSGYAAYLKDNDPERYKAMYGQFAAGGLITEPDPGHPPIPPVRLRRPIGYAGIQTEKGENLNPTSDQWIINMASYMRNNNPNSNIYRDKFSHHSVEMPKTLPPVAAYGGNIGRRKVKC